MPDDVSARSRWSRRVRVPALHFTLAGALLFVALGGPAARTATSAAKRTIVIDAERIRGLRRDYQMANHVRPSVAETRALVESLGTEEILYREAIGRGFEQGDRSIRWRVVQKMKYLGEDHGESDEVLYQKGMALGLYKSDPVVRRILVEKVRLVVARAAPHPSEDELRAWYAEHSAEYQQAERVTLRQVFFARGRRGDDAARAAADTAAALAREHGVEIAASLGGDPFVTGNSLTALGRQDLIKLFGESFADQALSLPAGKWSGPLRSTYGYHLVFVQERLAARVPSFDEVRARALESYEAAAQQRRVEEFLAGVRSGYTIRIDEEEIARGGRG